VSLPKGWTLATLGDLALYINGRGFKKSEWKTEGLPIIRIQNLNKEDADFNYADDSFEEKYRVKNGDLLVAWSASLGAYIWNRGNAWLNQHIFRVEPYKVIDNGFLYYAISESINELYQKSHGMGMVHVTKGVFEAHEVSLPPLNEQKRIAKKLDELLTTVESIKTRLDNAPTIIKRFRQSILAAATSGKLTEEWRKENSCQSSKELLENIISSRVEKYNLSVKEAKENGERKPQKQDGLEYPHITDDVDSPKEWEKAYLENVCEKIIDGTHKTPTYLDEGIQFLSAKNINNNKLDFTQTKYISLEEHKELSKRCKPIVGSLLLTKSGTIGRTAIVKTDKDFSLFESVAVITPSSEKIKSEYLQYVILNSMSNGILSKQVKGVAVQHLHLQDIRKIVFPLPLESEQKEIVSQVESLFSLADTLEEKIEAAKKRVDKLTQSILAKAFKGELVPQDPNDEPAEKLLERIKAEQEKEKPKKTRKKK